MLQKKNFFRFRHFLLAKKQPKLIKKNRQIYNITIEVVFFYLINLDYILKMQKRALIYSLRIFKGLQITKTAKTDRKT